MRYSVDEVNERFRQSLFAASFNICKNPEDAEDVVQDVLVEYHLSGKNFESEEHLRSWLFRVAINKSKNICKSFWRTHKTTLGDYMETLVFPTHKNRELFSAVLRLPEKFRIVTHLFYYEDYSIKEIADILKISESNAKTRLSRARALLKEKLQEEWNDD